MLRHALALQRWGGVRHGVGTASAISALRVFIPVALIVVSCLVVALATGLLSSPLRLVRTSPSLDATNSPTDQVLSYALGWRGAAEDPPVTLVNGLKVKSSNYRGVQIGGTTYYYNLSPRPSYDPLSRGEVTTQQIDIVAVRGDYPNRVMIYTIRTGEAAGGERSAG